MTTKAKLTVTLPDGSVESTTRNGGPYGDGRFFGRIDPSTGAWVAGRQATPAPVVAAVEALAADPAGAASRHGRMTGRCCFCDRRLDDDRSIGVGYGPVCAEKWGLPWGERDTV